MIYTFVAKLAMHGFYPNLNVAYPALFRWFFWIYHPFTVLDIVDSATSKNPRIGWINFHCYNGKASRCACKAAEEYCAGNRSHQRQDGRYHKEKFYDKQGKEYPCRNLCGRVGWGEPIYSRRPCCIGHGKVYSLDNPLCHKQPPKSNTEGQCESNLSVFSCGNTVLADFEMMYSWLLSCGMRLFRSSDERIIQFFILAAFTVI